MIMTILGVIQSQNPAAFSRQNQNKGKDFETIFNQESIKNKDFNKWSVASKQIETKDKATILSKDKAQNLMPLDQKDEYDIDDALANKNMDELLKMLMNMLSTLFPISDEFKCDMQQDNALGGFNLETRDEIQLLYEQLSALNAEIGGIQDIHKSGLSEEQFLKLAQIFQKLEPTANLLQIQKLIIELKELIYPEEIYIEDDLTKLDANNSHKAHIEINKTEKLNLNDSEQLSDNQFYKDIKAESANRNDKFKFAQNEFIRNNDSNIKPQDTLNIQKYFIGNKIIAENEGEAIQPTIDYPNHIKTLLMLGSRIISAVKPDIYNILNQLITQAEISLNKNSSEMQLQLQPDHLGRLAMKISVEKGAVIANIIVENHAVKGVLESNFNLLKDALDEKGFGIQEFQVSVGQDAHEQSQPNFMNFKNKNSSKPLSTVQQGKYEPLDGTEQMLSIYATQIDYLG